MYHEGKIYSRLLIAKAFNAYNTGAENKIVFLRRYTLHTQYDSQDSTKLSDPYVYELSMVDGEFRLISKKTFLVNEEAAREFVNLTMYIMPFIEYSVENPSRYYDPVLIFHSSIKIEIYHELLDEIIENIKRITSLLKKENAVIYTEYGAIRWM